MKIVLKIVDDMLGIKPVQYLLLLVTVVTVVAMFIISGVGMVRQKALALQLDQAKARAAECAAVVQVANARTAELEKRVKTAADEIQQINKDYTARIDKIRNTRMTSDTCAGMIAESVRLIQEGKNDGN